MTGRSNARLPDRRNRIVPAAADDGEDATHTKTDEI